MSKSKIVPRNKPCLCWSAGMAALVAILLCVSCSAPRPGSTIAGIDEKNTGWRELSLRHDDMERWFRVYQPRQLREDCPVVVVLHGGGQSMRKIFRPRSGGSQEWRAVADKEKILLLVPNGTNPQTGDTFGNRQSWNDVRNAVRVNNPEVDDVGFIRELLSWARANYRVDSQRYYVTGASNGGMMTFRLLMEMSGRIAAGAAFVANLPVEDQRMRVPQRAVPLLICNGTADPLVLWEGGQIPGERGNLRSAEQTVAWWVRANRADSNAFTEKLPDRDNKDGCRLTRTTYPALPGGAVVEFIRMQGGGHSLPSYKHPLPDKLWIQWLLGPVCGDIEGAWMAWEFLRRHRLDRISPSE